jgi:hypothetical protein
MDAENKSTWIKKQQYSDRHELIAARVTDDLHDFRQDPSGYYVLIRIQHKKDLIELGVCNSKHEIVCTFQGRSARDLWTALFDYESTHQQKWFSAKDHIAYLGKELCKAENALKMKTSYIQE